MKQRVITAVVLLALLAVVVWQINTPVLVLVIAFLAAVAANEIMRCAKVENTFIRVVATGYAACVPFFASAKALTPWVSEAVWGKVIGAVPGVVYLIALVLVLLLAMLKGYAYTTFEDVAVSVFAGALVPFGFSAAGYVPNRAVWHLFDLLRPDLRFGNGQRRPAGRYGLWQA